ncbi:hypothetical protein CI105_05625 [Candidatus Izimaplasma bacterium ZiA1]|uniref:type IV pilus twitching motility protein PilT n=1 Tax=Candidatus Izimoplasma sp. ZiA1 TaxID=2024899 RepID=UPI000BAA6497|nr:hypothetical protein CI105_05625 [Candidatus Izimaplasma bacterium ZiA1]
MLDRLLVEAINKNVSDVHITSDEYVYIRKSKKMIRLEVKTSSEDVLKIASEILEDRYDSLFKERQLDGSKSINGVRVRYNFYFERDKLSVALRIIKNEIRSIDDLMLPDVLKSLIKNHAGLILVTGPTGSGKSTTLAAMINEINQTMSKHIVTVEDPIEYIFENDKSLIHQREIGVDTLEFSDALRAVLRQDPDVIMLGELRDQETIETALKASETGHLVLSTLHTSGAKSTINRISGVFKGKDEERIRYLLSDSLLAVISQRLIPLADKTGVVPAFEILVNTNAISNLIKKGEVGQIDSYIKMNSKEGSISFDDSINYLIKSRRIDPNDL